MDMCLGFYCTMLQDLEFCDSTATCQQDLFPKDYFSLSGCILLLGDLSTKTFLGLFSSILNLLEPSLV